MVKVLYDIMSASWPRERNSRKGSFCTAPADSQEAEAQEAVGAQDDYSELGLAEALGVQLQAPVVEALPDSQILPDSVAVADGYEPIGDENPPYLEPEINDALEPEVTEVPDTLIDQLSPEKIEGSPPITPTEMEQTPPPPAPIEVLESPQPDASAVAPPLPSASSTQDKGEETIEDVRERIRLLK